MSRPFRSVLYIPASKERALEKARELAADAIIFDLEDAVAPEEKVAARATLARFLSELDYGPRLRIVRINGFDTDWGTNDLAKELASRYRADRLPLQAGLGLCLLAAKAEGRVIVDGVYNAFKDEAGLRAECAQGRDMGFDGKTLIHPLQLAVANEVFAPSEEEVTLARRQIEAFAQARAAGSGVAVLDGKIVENLHVAGAEAILAKAEAIAALAE